MILEDFAGIRNFTADEVTRTGAKLNDVDGSLLSAYDKFRDLVGRRVTLLPGGLTTGNHNSIWHKKGMAGDCALYEEDGPVSVSDVFKAALEAGFKGIGVYYNQIAYSFHLDLRPAYGFWARYREHREPHWHEVGLIVDPKMFLK
jgi:hypothetical protein